MIGIMEPVDDQANGATPQAKGSRTFLKNDVVSRKKFIQEAKI
jgi:hypothetical protein